MRFVLDASAVLEGDPNPDDELFTVPGVMLELRSQDAQTALERLSVTVRKPGNDALRRARAAAERTGDSHRLSETDTALIALALEEGVPLFTNDFSIQNTCRELGVPYVSPRDEITRSFRWELMCRDCGKRLERAGECPVCGGESRIRRTKQRR
ncbi:MAG: hypothetical protein QF415_03915 [Candidatus Undinarchaeales archaeon]|jgi:rRNA maturation endonuclease Nob1|nr:hypothetical protein [Candidatus Undinarchaeales archaeon]MDP7493263.1 hypothetical protein [Candidatus Undinarchaeales archaeon]